MRRRRPSRRFGGFGICCVLGGIGRFRSMGKTPQGQKTRGSKRREAGYAKKKQDRITGGDRTLNGFNTRAGIRIRCGTCNSDFCRAPNCPYRGNSVKNKPRRPHSSLSTESPVSVKGDRAPLTEGKKGQLSTALFNHSGYARPVCLHG